MAGGDVEAMLPFIAEEFEMTTPADLAAEPDTYRGHAGVRRWFESFYDAVDRIRFDASRFAEVGDRVAVEFSMTTRGRTTGLEASLGVAALCGVEHGKVKSLEFFASWDEAVAAAT